MRNTSIEIVVLSMNMGVGGMLRAVSYRMRTPDFRGEDRSVDGDTSLCRSWQQPAFSRMNIYCLSV